MPNYIGEILVKLGLDVADLKTGMAQVQNDVEKFAETLSAGFAGVAAGLGLGVAYEALKNITEAAVEAGTELIRVSERLNITTDALQNFQNVARETGTPVSEMERALGRLDILLEQAAQDNTRALQIFARLGMAWKDEAGNTKQVGDALGEFADHLNALPTAGEKLLVLRDAMGRNSQDMLNFFKVGAAGMDEISRSTVKMSTDSAQALKQVGDQWERTWSTAKTVFFEALVGSQIPTIITGYLKMFEEIGKALDLIGSKITGVATAIKNFGVSAAQYLGLAATPPPEKFGPPTPPPSGGETPTLEQRLADVKQLQALSEAAITKSEAAARAVVPTGTEGQIQNLQIQISAQKQLNDVIQGGYQANISLLQSFGGSQKQIADQTAAAAKADAANFEKTSVLQRNLALEQQKLADQTADRNKKIEDSNAAVRDSYAELLAGGDPVQKLAAQTQASSDATDRTIENLRAHIKDLQDAAAKIGYPVEQTDEWKNATAALTEALNKQDVQMQKFSAQSGQQFYKGQQLIIDATYQMRKANDDLYAAQQRSQLAPVPQNELRFLQQNIDAVQQATASETAYWEEKQKTALAEKDYATVVQASIHLNDLKISGQKALTDATTAYANAQQRAMDQLQSSNDIAQKSFDLLGGEVDLVAAKLNNYNQMINTLLQQNQDVPQSLLDARNAMWNLNQVSEFLHSTLQDVGNAFGRFVQDLQSGTKTIGQAFADLGKAISQALMNEVIKQGIQLAERYLNVFLGGLAGGGGTGSPFADTSGAGAFGTPYTFQTWSPAAQGGIVTKPTFILAGESGPEAIVPMEQLQRLPVMAGTGGGGTTINIINQHPSADVQQETSTTGTGQEVHNIIIREMNRSVSNGEMESILKPYALRRVPTGR
jgi:hypothetical protein